MRKDIKFLSNKHLFWDTDIQKIDVVKHKQSIIERVIQRGSWQDFKELLSLYGRASVVKHVRNIRSLDAKTMYFVCGYFDIPLKDLRCYTQQPLNPIPYL